MKATMLLADFAQVSDGKLTLIGAGWKFTPGGQMAIPFGLGIIVEIPWDRANQQHTWRLELVTEDGQPVNENGPDGDKKPIRLAGGLEVGRPAGVPNGSNLSAVLAINAPPLALPHNKGFEWCLWINDKKADSCTFRTRHPQ